MSMMHTLLAGYLRFAGRHQDAHEIAAAADAPASRASELLPLDELLPSAPLPPALAALVIYGDERDEHSGHPAASGGGAGNEAVAPATSPHRSAASAVAGADARAAAVEHGGSSGRAHEQAPAQEREPAHEQPREPVDEQPRDLHDDPLHGIYSHRLRHRIECDAFRSSSSTAQDSAVADAADRLLPPEVRSVLTRDMPHIDISPAARSARIDALAGEVPAWVKGDPYNDPSILRALASCASRVAAPPAAEKTRSPEALRNAVQPPASLASKEATHPARAAAGRDFER